MLLCSMSNQCSLTLGSYLMICCAPLLIIKNHESMILLLACEDRSGLIADLCAAIKYLGLNIVHLEQSVEKTQNRLFMRMSLEWVDPCHTLGNGKDALAHIMRSQGIGNWRIHHSDTKPRLAIWVSRSSHCLYALLHRHIAGRLNGDVVMVLSNHETNRHVAERFDLPFYHFPIEGNKTSQEQKMVALCQQHEIDSIILARYMQILSAETLAAYPRQVINIHHSFLPAFSGARPYHRAWQRGVKLIGATSHYVTEALDEGPIITQEVIPVNH